MTETPEPAVLFELRTGRGHATPSTPSSPRDWPTRASPLVRTPRCGCSRPPSRARRPSRRSARLCGRLVDRERPARQASAAEARRRRDRRRRALRDRCGVPAADASARRRASRSSRPATSCGGTWDLFRYPGIRSDSDMFTLGYQFKPLASREGHRRRADDPELHPRDRAEFGIERAHPLSARGSCGADWSSDHARWTLDLRDGSRTSAR